MEEDDDHSVDDDHGTPTLILLDALRLLMIIFGCLSICFGVVTVGIEPPTWAAILRDAATTADELDALVTGSKMQLTKEQHKHFRRVDALLEEPAKVGERRAAHATEWVGCAGPVSGSGALTRGAPLHGSIVWYGQTCRGKLGNRACCRAHP